MKIPNFKKYSNGEYSLIQIAPTLDSQEIVNIGVIVKNIDTNEIEIKLFDDISKLSKRIYIENKDSLSYTFDILKKHAIKVMVPKGLNLEAYLKVVPNFEVVEIEPNWQSSLFMYNKLKLSSFFYDLFKEFDLIQQVNILKELKFYEA